MKIERGGGVEWLTIKRRGKVCEYKKPCTFHSSTSLLLVKFSTIDIIILVHVYSTPVLVY